MSRPEIVALLQPPRRQEHEPAGGTWLARLFVAAAAVRSAPRAVDVSKHAIRSVAACLVVQVALFGSPGEAAAQTAIPAATQQEEQTEEASSEATPEREIIPFPVLISNPTNGFGGGGGLLTLYRLNETDPQDSQTAVIGYYTTTDSWLVGGRQIFSFGEDRFRSTTVAVLANTNNRFSYTDRASDIVYGERRSKLETDFTVDVYRGLFVGLNYLYRNIDFTFDQGTPEEQEFSEAILTAAGAEKTIDSGGGLVVYFDNRDHEYTPTQGVFATLKYQDFVEWLGSDNDYGVADAFFNAYWNVKSAHRLAFRFRWRATFGDVPFSGQSTYGGVDLRAYPTGKYRGAGMLAGQAEYRFPIWKRLRGAAFGGSGRVYGEELTLGANRVLPSGGAGVRFLLLPDRDLLVGLDVAVGRFDNKGVYFSFGEAF